MLSQLAPIAYLNDQALKASRPLALEMETLFAAEEESHSRRSTEEMLQGYPSGLFPRVDARGSSPLATMPARESKRSRRRSSTEGGRGEGRRWRWQRLTANLLALGTNAPVVDLAGGITVTPFTLAKALVSAVGGNVAVALYRALRGSL